MGMKGPSVEGDPQAGDPLGHVPLDLDRGRRAAHHAKPHHAGRAARRKDAESAERQGKRLDVDGRSQGFDDAINALVSDLTEKRERQMQVSGRDPFERGSCACVDRRSETPLLVGDGRARGVTQLHGNKQTHWCCFAIHELVNW